MLLTRDPHCAASHDWPCAGAVKRDFYDSHGPCACGDGREAWFWWFVAIAHSDLLNCDRISLALVRQQNVSLDSFATCWKSADFVPGMSHSPVAAGHWPTDSLLAVVSCTITGHWLAARCYLEHNYQQCTVTAANISEKPLGQHRFV